MRENKPDHIETKPNWVLRKGTITCTNCEDRELLLNLSDVQGTCDTIGAFCDLHADCKPQEIPQDDPQN